jgi:hypothetical protein
MRSDERPTERMPHHRELRGSRLAANYSLSDLTRRRRRAGWEGDVRASSHATHIVTPEMRQRSPLDLMLALFCHRATGNIYTAISALEDCRRFVRGEVAQGALESALTHLQQAERIQHLLSRRVEGTVSLPELFGELAAAIHNCGCPTRPTRISLHLDPVEIDGNACPYVLTLIAELLAEAMQHCNAYQADTVTVALRRSEDGLIITVACSRGNARAHELSFDRNSAVCGLLDALVVSLGASIRREDLPNRRLVAVYLPSGMLNRSRRRNLPIDIDCTESSCWERPSVPGDHLSRP